MTAVRPASLHSAPASAVDPLDVLHLSEKLLHAAALLRTPSGQSAPAPVQSVVRGAHRLVSQPHSFRRRTPVLPVARHQGNHLRHGPRVSVAPQLLADGARCAHLLHLGARQVQEKLDEIAVDEAARLPAQNLAQSAIQSGRFGIRKGLPGVAIVVERAPFGVLEAADAVHHLGHRLLQLPETPELCPANRNSTGSMPGLSQCRLLWDGRRQLRDDTDRPVDRSKEQRRLCFWLPASSWRSARRHLPLRCLI